MPQIDSNLGIQGQIGPSALCHLRRGWHKLASLCLSSLSLALLLAAAGCGGGIEPAAESGLGVQAGANGGATTSELPPPPPHWAYLPLAEPAVPVVNNVPDPLDQANPIDAFVSEHLTQVGHSAAVPANRAKLLRRVTLGLTGLPPTLEELDAFLKDPSAAAYEQVVDRLLASPRYAEHMTAEWLDIARYSDTDGFQYDGFRPAWPWRDWVLQAFDSNMPWDRFTLEQLAGDLLPDATPQQKLATGFNRNHAIQGENGLLQDEFRDQYVSDRLDTLGKAWLGVTVGCAKCHNHKFEPLTSNDYFQLYDCFNSIDEGDNGPATKYSPTVNITSPLLARENAEFDARIALLSSDSALAWDVTLLSARREEANRHEDMRVMGDLPTLRETKVLAQGRYDAPKGAPVHCKAPSFLPPFPAGAPSNRLGLARWLTMPENPLTARVTVNRAWARHFGRGLVPSLDNFGTQVPAPIYATLLDWLATHFVKSGWDLKALHKLIVTSSTYQQDSALSPDALAFDPNNEHLARGPLHPLAAEVVRDLPLAVSGLLVHRFGGPPEYPYQPPGLWEEVSWEAANLSYPVLTGDTLYRRSVYTFWKRTLPPPLMSILDAPDRDHSSAMRELSITPQQVLALMNGPQFVEAARQLAERVRKATGTDVNAALALGFRSVTSRDPTSDEAAELLKLYTDQQAQLLLDPAALEALQRVGSSRPSPFEADAGALTSVMRVLFGLVETTTQE